MAPPKTCRGRDAHGDAAPEDVLGGDRAFCSCAIGLLPRGTSGCHVAPQRQMVDLTRRAPNHAKPSARRRAGRLPLAPQLGVRTPRRVGEPVSPPVHPRRGDDRAVCRAPAGSAARVRDRVDQAAFGRRSDLGHTLLEIDLYPDDALAELYHRRWHQDQHGNSADHGLDCCTVKSS